VTARAKFPPKASGTWPAIWLLGANCQNTNPHTADVGYDSCPAIGSASYAEIDMVECDLNNWCQLALANYANTGSGGQLFPTCGYPTDGRFHIFTLTWTARAVSVAVDGQSTGCAYSSPGWTIPSTPMFLIIQTQTGGVGGKPVDALLPARLEIDFVRVTQP
jgi:beta-glucanase (GH16 family)